MKKEHIFQKIIAPILLVLSGVFYSFILPPQSQYDLAWFGLVPLLIAARVACPKASFWYGFSFGLGFWTPGIWWFLSLGNKGCPFWLIIISYVLLVVACALFIAVFAMLVSKLWQGVHYISYDEYITEQNRIDEIESDREYEREAAKFAASMKKAARRISISETWRIPVIAFIWVGLEYLRGAMGFSWNTLAISQYKSYAIAQLAAWGGTAVISFLIVVVNAGLSGVVVRIWRMLVKHEYPRIRRHLDLWVALIVAMLAMVSGVREFKYQDKVVNNLSSPNDLILVGAINNHDTPYLQKKIGTNNIFNDLLYNTYDLSTNGVDLIVWPETSVPFLLPEPSFDALIKQFVDEGNFSLIAGGVENVFPESKDPFNLGYNVSCLYTPGQGEKSVYRKRHLVPFGEYLPLDETIPFIRKFAPFGYSVQAGKGGQLFDVKGISVGMLICFEDTYSWPARESVNAGARLLISQSNDMWFDDDSEKLQHHANAVFRAIETRTPLLRVSNEGYMGVVLPTGKTGQLYGNDTTMFSEYIIARSEETKPTFYMLVGDWILAKPAAIFVVIFILFLCYKRYLYKKNLKNNGAENMEVEHASEA